MKKIKLVKVLIIFLVTFIYSSCTDDNEINNLSFTLTPLAEDGLSVNWTILGETNQLEIKVAEDESLSVIVFDTIFDNNINSINIINLPPASDLFIEITTFNADKIINKEVKSVSTSYHQEIVYYESTDDITLCASINYATRTISDTSKYVIFMHHFGGNKSKWYPTSLFKMLIKTGYICLNLDLRGHGDSTPLNNLSMLINEPTGLNNDLNASINYLKNLEMTNDIKVVLVGASLGACISAGGTSYNTVIGGVALSGVYSITEKMFDQLKPQGVFYVAGELDYNSTIELYFKDDAQLLFDITTEPKKIRIIRSSRGHGIDLLISNYDLELETFQWIINLQ